MHTITSISLRLSHLILILFFIVFGLSLKAQTSTPNNGICELPVFEDWSSGSGANPCACRWVDPQLNYMICSYGNCGSLEFQECSSDCAGGQLPPSGWYQGGGNYGSTSCLMMLPVELAYFKGTSNNQRVELVWKTLSERDCSHFEVLHSTNGTDYESLTYLDAVGNSTEENNYAFLHQKVAPGIHYYKLRIVDINGEYEESTMISVDNRHATGNHLFSDIYPNPSNDVFRLTYFGNDFETDIHVAVYSYTGKLVYEESIYEFGGKSELEIPSSQLENGLYRLQITQGQNIEIKTVSVQH